MARVITRTGAAEWAKRVEEWRASGEVAAAFAQPRGWNPRTMTWWESELRRRSSPNGKATGFVRLVAKAEPAAGRPGAMAVVLGNARTVRVEPGVDLAFLRAVVEALEAGR